MKLVLNTQPAPVPKCETGRAEPPAVGPLKQSIPYGNVNKPMICPICSWSPENQEYLFIYESRYWRIVLAPNQILLGRCVVHLKRHCGDIADIQPDEMVDWLNIVVIIETALRKAFNTTLFNWSCLMNQSYREDPPNPHIHWWVVPRYNHSVNMDNYVFEDPKFGAPYDPSMRLDLPKDIRQRIVDQIVWSIT